MKKKASDDWGRISVRKALVEKAEEFLKTDEAKELGLTNISQVFDFAIRELVKDLIGKRFEHVNTFEDKVRILDNQIGKHGDIVTIFFREQSGFCEYCQKTDCIHVKYAWEISEVARILKKHGLKPPF